MTKESGPTTGRGQVQFLNPPSLHQNPAFTNVVVVTGPARTIYVGGQNAVDSSGVIVGKGDLDGICRWPGPLGLPGRDGCDCRRP